MSRVTREFDILTVCARGSVSGKHLATLPSLLEASDFDWEALLSLASRHAMRPLLYHHLSTLELDQSSENSMRALHDRSLQNSLRSVALTAELMKTLALLEETGIPALCFKGPVLAARAYGDITLREFYDLDVIVPPSDIVAARELLSRRGYVALPKFSTRELRSHLGTQNVLFMTRENADFAIELHWRLFPKHFSFDLDTDQLIQRSVALALVGRCVRALNPVDEILHLAAHGARHQWYRLEWLAAFAKRLGTLTDAHWEELYDRSDRLGGARMLHLGLRLANKILGTGIPPRFDRRVIADVRSGVLADTVGDSLPVMNAQPPTTWERGRFMLRVRERWYHRVRYVVRLGLTPTQADFDTIHLPPKAFPAYVLIRLVRLLNKYAASRGRSFKRPRFAVEIRDLLSRRHHRRREPTGAR